MVVKEKRIMKRIIAAFLSLLLICTFMIPQLNAYGEDNYIEASVNVLTKDEYYSMFKIEPEQCYVKYSYEIINSNSTEEVEVTAFIDLHISAAETYHFNLSGKVQKINLEESILLEGPLTGYSYINNDEYYIQAGFLKLQCSDSVRFTVTIQSMDESNQQLPVILTFGEFGLTRQMLDAINNRNVELQSSEYSRAINYNDRSESYYTVGGSYVGFNCSASGTGQHLKVSFCPSFNRLAVSIKSYNSTLTNYYAPYGAVDTSVSSCSYTLTRSITDASYILNTESYSFDAGNYGAGTVYLYALFCDIMDYLNIPTSTISAILNSLYGSVSRNIYSNTASVYVSFGAGQYANFSAEVPIVFQLDYSGSYSGNSGYTASTSLQYRVTMYEQYEGLYYYAYYSAYNASYYASISLT